MKNILVPTDFSDEAEVALKVAAQLARKHDSEIYLLHMLELPLQLIDPVQGNSQNLPEALFFMKLAHQRFRELMSKPFLKGITVYETVEFHKAFDGIMEISKDYNCELIVMGSKGTSGFGEIFVGSNTEKVVRHSDIPVLVIKNEAPEFSIKKFVFATDGEAEESHTLAKAIKFSELLGAQLHLVYVNTPNQFLSSAEAEQKLEDFCKPHNYQNLNKVIYNDLNIEEGILNYAKKIDADLIGISTHGRKGLAHFFNGSIGEDVVNHAQRPVVTFKI